MLKSPAAANERVSATGSLRDRLLLSFSDLAAYGIYAQPEMPFDVADGRAFAYARILDRYPHAIGSYVFWTEGDASRFNADGNVASGDSLPLYHSGADVTPIARVVCARLGVIVTGAEDGDILLAQRASAP
jgi:hypothetical protein